MQTVETLEERTIERPAERVHVHGRFTVVEIVKDGIIGVGVSRRCQGDEMSSELGISIAKGRAEKAIQLKKEKKRLNHHYLG